MHALHGSHAAPAYALTGTANAPRSRALQLVAIARTVHVGRGLWLAV